MPRPRKPIPPGTVYGNDRVVADAPDQRSGGQMRRAVVVESLCCGRQRVAMVANLAHGRRAERCRSCERVARGRDFARKRLEARAKRLRSYGLTPGRASDEVFISQIVEPSSIRTLDDLRRAIAPGAFDGLCGTVRGCFIGEAA